MVPKSASGEVRSNVWHDLAAALDPHPDEQAYTAAADAWVGAVDDGSIASWDSGPRERLERMLIDQPGVDVRPPIFHHRISAQHASSIKGHLARAAEALEPLLQSMLQEDEDNPKVVLMLLLLRSQVKGIDQQRITSLHRKHFTSFPVEDLAIPYSVMFHRAEYGRNADDLAQLVRDEGDRVADGSWPLTHLLHAYWLAPSSFAGLREGWAARAVAARRDKLNEDEQELASARSFALRLGGGDQEGLAAAGDGNDFDAAIRDLAARRAAFDRPSAKSERAAARIENNLRRAGNVAWNLAAAKAPVLVGLRRRPKVAICVSGQLRGFQAAFETWKHLLLPGIDATIFVSSWKRIGRASPEPFRYVLPFAGARFTEAYKAVGTELGLPDMKQRYPSLYAALDQSADTSEAELSAFYRTPHVHLDDEQEPTFAALSNPDKMHRKIEHSFQMARGSGEEFDLYLRIRPDKPVRMIGFSWDDMANATDGLPRLYTENAMGVHYAALEIGDQFAVGGLHAMQVYSETWSRAPDLWRFGLRMFQREMTGHVTLAQMCWLHGIDVRRAPMKFGALQDPEPLAVSVIRDALVRDSASRSDPIDRRLLAAIEADAGERR